MISRAGSAQPANLNGTWLRNTFMAGEALQLTLGVYTRSIAVSHNNATPTPHWVGFTIYHVEKDLAKGLYLYGVKKEQ